MAISSSTYRALQIAAERIGANNYARGLAAHVRAGRKPGTYRYAPTDAHKLVIAAMSFDSDDSAMAVLHDYDVMQERFA